MTTEMTPDEYNIEVIPGPRVTHYRQIINMAFPIVLGMMSQVLLGIVDMAMVGHIPGGNNTVAIAAVGYTTQILLICSLSFGAILIAAQASVSRRFGEQKFVAAGQVLDNAFLLSAVVGFGASAIGYLLTPFIMVILSQDPAIQKMGGEYLGIRFLVMGITVLGFASRGFLYGIGKVRVEMRLTIITALLNVLLAWLWIFGHWGFPALGVRGAALASAVSTGLGFLITMGYYIYGGLWEKYRYFRVENLSLPQAWALLKVSAPRSLQVMSMISIVVLMSFVDKIGRSELAAVQLIMRVNGFSFMFALALGTVAATLIGQKLGAKKPDEAEAAGWDTIKIGILVTFTLGILIAILGHPIMRLFTNDVHIIDSGLATFQMAAACTVIGSINVMFARCLQGAGDTYYVMLVDIIVSWCVMVPLGYVIAFWWNGGVFFTWMAQIFRSLIVGIILLRKYRTGDWKHIKV